MGVRTHIAEAAGLTVALIDQPNDDLEFLEIDPPALVIADYGNCEQVLVTGSPESLVDLAQRLMAVVGGPTAKAAKAIVTISGGVAHVIGGDVLTIDWDDVAESVEAGRDALERLSDLEGPDADWCRDFLFQVWPGLRLDSIE